MQWEEPTSRSRANNNKNYMLQMKMILDLGGVLKVRFLFRKAKLARTNFLYHEGHPRKLANAVITTLLIKIG